MIAEVIIDSKVKQLNKKFDYEIPSKLQDVVTVGSRVLVPFGKLKSLEQGYIIKIKESTEYEVKEIAGLEENLTEKQIELARWMARKYFCNVSECIKLMLTPGNKGKNEKMSERTVNFVYLNRKDVEGLKGEKQKKLVEFLKQNEGLTIPEIEQITGISRTTVNSLVKKDILKIENQKIDRNPLINRKITKNNKLELNEEQKEAYEKIASAIDENRSEKFLLYGVTGSRKNGSIFTINRKNNTE